jgi:hypothetical protein
MFHASDKDTRFQLENLRYLKKNYLGDRDRLKDIICILKLKKTGWKDVNNLTKDRSQG